MLYMILKAYPKTERNNKHFFKTIIKSSLVSHTHGSKKSNLWKHIINFHREREPDALGVTLWRRRGRLWHTLYTKWQKSYPRTDNWRFGAIETAVVNRIRGIEKYCRFRNGDEVIGFVMCNKFDVKLLSVIEISWSEMSIWVVMYEKFWKKKS